MEDDENLDLWTVSGLDFAFHWIKNLKVWGNLIKSWEIEWKRRPKCVKELARRGIPQHFRTIAWQLLSGAQVNQVQSELYAEYMRQPSPYEKAIARDIPRTFPELDFFKDGGRGQQSLFNVIKAYSLHDREVRNIWKSWIITLCFCRWDIVKDPPSLLANFSCKCQRKKLLLFLFAWWKHIGFVNIFNYSINALHLQLRELYKPTMTELGLCMFQLEVMVQEQIPDLYMHL